MHKINGSGVLVGFSDYFDGYVESAVGAAPGTGPAPGKPVKPAPYPKGKHNPTVANHRKVLSQAHAVATRATQTINKALAQLGKAVSGGHKAVHVGAAPNMTSKAKAAIQKHNAAVAKAGHATKALAGAALKAKSAVKTLAQKMVAQGKVDMSLRTPKKMGTHVGALLDDPVVGGAVASYYEEVGCGPDPDNFGFLEDGSPDLAARTLVGHLPFAVPASPEWARPWYLALRQLSYDFDSVPAKQHTHAPAPGSVIHDLHQLSSLVGRYGISIAEAYSALKAYYTGGGGYAALAAAMAELQQTIEQYIAEHPDGPVMTTEHVHVGLDLNGNAPGQPGYDPTTADGTSPGEPGYDPTMDPSSPQYGVPAAGTPAVLPVDLATLDMTTLHTAPDMNYYVADMTDPKWSGGVIAYDGSKGTPDGFAGSYNFFNRGTDRNITAMTSEIDGNEHHGYVFGAYDWKDPRLGSKGGNAAPQPGGGIPWGSSLRSGKWNWVHGRHEMGSEDWHTDVPTPAAIFQSADPNYQGDPSGVTAMANSAYNQPFGPIVGNPAMPDFAHMRVDGQGRMFWFAQEAPDWLLFPLKQAAALTAQATAQAKAAADAANAAAIAKTNADAAVAKAAQDAQNALAESKATSDANVVQSQATATQATIETQAQQALVDQANADAQAQQIDAQQAQQAGALLLQQAQAQQQYAAQHPDQFYGPGAQQTADQGGGGDDGSGDQDDQGGDDQGDGSGDQGDGADAAVGSQNEDPFEVPNAGMIGIEDDLLPDPEAMDPDDLIHDRFRYGGDIIMDIDGENFPD